MSDNKTFNRSRINKLNKKKEAGAGESSEEKLTDATDKETADEYKGKGGRYVLVDGKRIPAED